MSRNISVNKKLGGSQTPFINANVAADALAVPLKHKNSGLFEAQLIRANRPSLTVCPSDCGNSSAAEPPLKRRLSDLAVLMRPPQLRRLTF